MIGLLLVLVSLARGWKLTTNDITREKTNARAPREPLLGQQPLSVDAFKREEKNH